jgi:glycosyltransferase involved in cell wall biosynthesis
VLVSVGALVERKGQHRTLEVLPGLLKEFPDLKLLLVGSGGQEGDMEPRLREMVAENGLEDAVVFMGQRKHDALKAILSAADVFVLPTRFEGWANVFFEAMACGLPVVTTRVCGNPEVVKEGQTGLLVEFGEPEALQSALAQALSTEWDREAIAAYAASRPWDTVAEEVVAQFEDLLGKPRSA